MPEDLGIVVAVSTGGEHTCAVRPTAACCVVGGTTQSARSQLQPSLLVRIIFVRSKAAIARCAVGETTPMANSQASRRTSTRWLLSLPAFATRARSSSATARCVVGDATMMGRFQTSRRILALCPPSLPAPFAFARSRPATARCAVRRSDRFWQISGRQSDREDGVDLGEPD